MGGKYDTQEFIRRARLNPDNDLYEYDNVIYTGCFNEVIINCKLHGKFPQMPAKHLYGQGCSKCAGRYKPTTEEFIANAKAIDNNDVDYDYSEVIYVNSKTPLKIICKLHGAFMQSPHDHINNKSGCNKCSKVYVPTTEEFVIKAKSIKDNAIKYDYSNVVYVNAKTPVKIKCMHHGYFWQTPDNHLQKKGCPTCVNIISTMETLWLNNIEKANDIVIIRQQYLKLIKTKIDGYDPLTNTVYEFHGDYWHGNPSIYNPNDINKKCKKTFGELYLKTIERENALKSAGYNLVVIWENDFKEFLKQEKLRI